MAAFFTFMTRGQEITVRYLKFLDGHVKDVVNERAHSFLSIRCIASELAISHTHLTDTIKKETGKPPKYFYNIKIIEQIKNMLIENRLSAAEIARICCYDPSNFSKFFKKHTTLTPVQWRNTFQSSRQN